MTKEESIEKGERGEQAFAKWLDKEGLGYVYIKQTLDAFASSFEGKVKRPDFLVLLESIGMLAVDVKNHELTVNENTKKKEYTLTKDKELKGVQFERIFRIPVWYAYYNETKDHWHWISALKAFEVGKERINEDGTPFFAIELDQFVRIDENDDLGKLYTQRMK